MKKINQISCLGLMAVLALTGCSSNEDLASDAQSSADSQSNAISFSSYIQKTRTNLTNDNIKNYKIVVAGYNASTGAKYLGASTFGNGTLMQYGGESIGTWGNVTESEAKEWPTDGTKLNFIACAPYSDNPTNPTVSTNGIYSASFASGANANETALTISGWMPPYTDVCYATNMNVESPDAEPATLNFVHALVQLNNFRVKLLQPGFRVEIMAVQLCNVKSNATITIPLNANPATDANYKISYTNKQDLLGETKLKQIFATPKQVTYLSTDPCATDESKAVALFENLGSFIIPASNSELWYYSGSEAAGTHPAATDDKLFLKLYLRVWKLKEDGTDDKQIFPTTDTSDEYKETIGGTEYGITWIPFVNKESSIDLQAGHKYSFNLNMRSSFGYTPGKDDGSTHEDPKPHYFDSNIKFNVTTDDWQEDVVNITI